MTNSLYVWFDTEYSNLELETAVLLQVAAIITDTSLRRVLPRERDVSLTIRLPHGITASPWVEQHLPDLLNACRSSAAIDVGEADTLLSAYVDAAQGAPIDRRDERPTLAGNSVHADWWLVRRFLPGFLSRLNYRLLDVTAFKLEWKRLHPDAEFQKEDREMIRAYFPEAALTLGGRHDARYDVEASIAEMGFYRKHFLRQET
jgi:oligoribonuclease (3'-5' exoribonuclease)